MMRLLAAAVLAVALLANPAGSVVAQRPPTHCQAVHKTGGGHFRWSVWVIECDERAA